MPKIILPYSANVYLILRILHSKYVGLINKLLIVLTDNKTAGLVRDCFHVPHCACRNSI